MVKFSVKHLAGKGKENEKEPNPNRRQQRRRQRQQQQNQHQSPPSNKSPKHNSPNAGSGTPPLNNKKGVVKVSNKRQLKSETPRISNISMIPPVPIGSSCSSSSSNNYPSSTTGSIASNITSTTAPTIATTSRITRTLPGLFTLIEQGNWKRVAARASKYPNECHKWVTIQKKHSSMASSPSSSSSPRMMSGANSVSSFNTKQSSSNASVDNSVHSSASTLGAFPYQTSIPSVTCKALHHACHRLNNVHSQIRDLITSSVDDMNHHVTSLPRANDGSPHASSKSSSNSPPNPLKLERKSTADSLASCVSACNMTEGLSFDDPSDDQRGQLAGRISPTFGRIVNYVKDKMPSSPSSTFNKRQYDQEWDDPWIEACKAILTILEMNPEAAGRRESRHGCFPLHLAVFAMRPTPTAKLPEDYVQFKYEYTGCPLFSSTSVPSIPKQSNIENNNNNCGAGVSHKEVIAASNQYQFSGNDINISLPPNSSAVSCSSVQSSIGGFSSTLIDGGGCSIGASSTLDDNLSDKMTILEEKLRLRKESQGESSGITEKEQVKLLEYCARPAPISRNLDCGVSIGSIHSNCSNSVVSNSSTVMPLPPGPSPRSKPQEFYLDKYIANAQRREEYSLKVLNALLNAYPKGATKDSEGGRMPLHTAATGRATFRVIETLARVYPNATRQRTKDGSLPLHLAAYYGVSDDRVAPLLLRYHPDAAIGRNKWERTPLEEGLLRGGENGRDHQMKLTQALRHHPSYWTRDNTPQPIRGTFDHADVQLSQNENAYDDYGLDRRMASVDDDSDEDDNDDLITLIKRHQWNLIIENIDFFSPMLQNPIVSAVRAGYNAKLSALHLACEQNPTYEVMDALVSACPASITWRTLPGGQLPLHLAATWKASSSVIGFLIAANPRAARQIDGLGNLPLHSACFSGAPEEVIESLLCTFPKAIHIRNNLGSSPADVVRRLSHRNKKPVLNLIERVSLELLKKRRQCIGDVQVPAERKQKQTRKNQSENKEVTNENDVLVWV